MLEGEWPHDPRLDPFRDAVWKLSRDGEVEAFLTTEVSRMRSLPFFWVKHEWLWYQVNWVDGRRDRADEDYGPEWYTVADLEQGKFDHPDVGLIFDAEPVEGSERAELWERFGRRDIEGDPGRNCAKSGVRACKRTRKVGPIVPRCLRFYEHGAQAASITA